MINCHACGTPNDENARFCTNCGATLAAPPADPLIGLTIGGKFTIEKKIGEGGMGAVYAGMQQGLGRRVAIKVMHKHLTAQDRTVAERFRREAQSASLIEHPNSIQIYDFGQIEGDGSMYMVMEYLPGGSLFKVIREEFPLSTKRVVHVMSQICSVLAAAHDKGIIHRDMKPENVILVTRNEDKSFVKVLDFGIAKITESSELSGGPPLTRMGFICGTAEYMAPEQAMGQHIDRRVDIYALGCMLYEMLTGDVPFTGKTYQVVLQQHIQTPPMAPSMRRPDLRLHPELERIALKAMAKSRDERYDDCRQMKGDLDRVLSMDAPTMDTARTVMIPQGGAQAGPGRSGTTPTPGGTGYGGSPTAFPPGGGNWQGQTLYAGDLPPQKPARTGLWVGVGLGGGALAAAAVALVMWPKAPAGAGHAVGHSPAGAPTAPALEPAATPDQAMNTRPAAGAPAENAAAPADDVPFPTPDPSAAKKPGESRKLFKEGNKLLAEERAREAVAVLQRAVAADPTQPRPYNSLAQAWLKLDNKPHARACFEKYLELAGDDAADAAAVRGMLNDLK